MNTPSTNATFFAGFFSALVLALALSPTTSAGEELGRLFFTPERRQALDRQRQHNIVEKQQEATEDPTLTINGIVIRSSGRRTVWINGIAQNENGTSTGVSVTQNKNEPGKIGLQPTGAPALSSKVGNTVNRTTGESTDLINGGRISIRPAGPR